MHQKVFWYKLQIVLYQNYLSRSKLETCGKENNFIIKTNSTSSDRLPSHLVVPETPLLTKNIN